eukprot:CAMPEP_0197415504 /NCGR_PEP_ID=MMETSP1170-20131217/2021_1 /TAXON_ID=54406 /ORGANISM="Sarcinochrysis sp, Strain CCMP770" /LENGTH=87 /DNA_ID=CAMNT_0042942311 /DNA_START=53 /DNA_END=316 /DNA_ORIENTATION=+
MSSKGPDLKRYMEKRLMIRIKGKRKVNGYLRGYDQFMNLVLEDAVEEVSKTERRDIGTIVLRGNSIENFELMEREAQIDRCTGQVLG